MDNTYITDFVSSNDVRTEIKKLNFFDAVSDTLKELPYNKSITENGAVGYKTTGSALVDINYMTSSLRQMKDKKLMNMFMAAYYENPLYAWKWLFFLRDIRGGMGERETFKRILKEMAINRPEETALLIPLIAEYGRYDDTWVLLDTPLIPVVIQMINSQLQVDIDNFLKDKPVSLLAKWLPKRNASSPKTRHYAKIIVEGLKVDSKTYNKMLVKLRTKLNLVESNMCANKWSAIDYNTVPSKANLIYRNAFLKHDPERRTQYLEDLKNGKDGVKINATTNFLHDIVHKYFDSYTGWKMNVKAYDETLEQLWKNQKDTVNGSDKVMVIHDGSGSMYTTIDNASSVMAETVATALAIYFSERCSGQFKDRFITFSSNPKMIDLSNCKTLQEKIKYVISNRDCSNTNIQKTFELLLNTAIRNNFSQKDLPNTLLIITDGEFDCMVQDRPDKTLFENLADKFADYGYKLPKLVFWNICSRTGTIPVKENENGVALVSGYSVNIMNMVLSNELDPLKCLMNQLNTERYQLVEDTLRKMVM